MKLSQIVSSAEALKRLLEVKLPVKIAYKISKLVSKIEPELKIYEEQRNKLIQDLGEETDKEKGVWTVKADNMPKFKEEATKLADIEVNLEFSPGQGVEKIKIEDLGEISLTSNDLLALNWLIE